jgi:competence protein ComEC
VKLPGPLPCAVALAAAIALTSLGDPPHGPPPTGATPDDRVDDRVVGTIGAPVVRTARGYGALLDADGGSVWIWTDRAVAPGERVAVTGKLRAPRGYRDPGVPDRAASFASRGAAWELSATQLERLADEPSWRDRAWRAAAVVQLRWAAAIASRDPCPASSTAEGRCGEIDEAGGDAIGRAALRGIVTGDRGDVPDELDRRWRAIGIYHVLSVSGLHLAVVAGLVFALLRRLLAASPLGGRVRPARWAAPPAIALAIAYTAVTGAQLATIRALVVVVVVLVAAMLDRPVRLVDAIAIAAIAVLAWRPADLYDPSFQLSFAAALTLAIAPRGAPGAGIARKLARGVATSAWVALTTAPITAYHFHQVAAGGVVGNLVLTPIVELVALPVALAGLIAREACAPLGDALVHVAAWLVARVDDGAALLARVTPVGTIGVASAATMAALVVLSLVLVARPRRGRAAAWLAACALWLGARDEAPPGALRVTFLDVGQGDAALVELPDGATWLVDAGGIASARDLAAASAPGRAIAATLAVYGKHAIDLAIVSHPHPDHYLGFAAIDVPIDELWAADEADADAPHPPRGAQALPSFADLARALAARGTRVVHPPLGVARSEAGVELVVWAPRLVARDGAPPVEAVDPVRTVNDNSLVVAIRYAGRTIVFTGDVEAEGEDALVAAGLADATIVKVPHHGSPTSSTPAFVAALHPALAVISCGVANTFGFPSPAVMARWRGAGAAIERTDLSGAIVATIDRDGAVHVTHPVP